MDKPARRLPECGARVCCRILPPCSARRAAKAEQAAAGAAPACTAKRN